MDNKKIKDIQEWMENVKKQDCNSYIAIAVNEKKSIVSTADGNYQTMFEMIASCCERNESFKEVVLMVAAFILEKNKKNQETKKGDEKCSN